MTEAGGDAAGAHKAFAVAAFNGAWELIDKNDRTANDDRQLLTLAFASRWHWNEIGTPENRVIADWQVAHVASLVGQASLALMFAQLSYDASRGEDVPDWMRASGAEGMARAYACAGDSASYQRYATEARELCALIAEDEDRELILGQLASIPAS